MAQYVIGIDFGHGETSAAFCPLQLDVPYGQLDPIQDIDFSGNKAFPSALRVKADGSVLIGHAAYAATNADGEAFRVCFKKRPSAPNGMDEQMMIKFMKAVYAHIRSALGSTLNDDNHVVYIATPSGWDKQAAEIYLAMARQAGLPVGGVTRESRAALVQARHLSNFTNVNDANKGTVVFDMGSSTLDLTYYNESLDRQIDYGYDCGASYVERSILESLNKGNDDTKQFLRLHPELKDRVL